MKNILFNDFIETFCFGDGLFRSLGEVEPIRDETLGPAFMAGREGPTFRVRIGGVAHALKCYSVPSPEAQRLHTLLSELHSDIIICPTYLPQELWMGEEYADVAIYPWVEGRMLEWEMRRAAHFADPERFAHLATLFARLALDILSSEWRHGDLKPENIIVTPDDRLTLLDCDSLYHPTLPSRGHRGTPPYSHPSRGDAYDEHIDDHAIALILCSLEALAREPKMTTSELMVADPKLGFAGLLGGLFADSEPLTQLLAELHSDDYRIPNLKEHLQCILHK